VVLNGYIKMKWIKNKIAMVLFSLSVLDKKILAQKTNTINDNIDFIIEKDQGALHHGLRNQIVNEEVKKLRWRMYKVLKEINGVNVDIVGYDDNNMPITKIKKVDKKVGLSKIKLDSYDRYKLEMVIDNTEIPLSGIESFDNDKIDILETPKNNFINGVVASSTHGNISANEYFATHKSKVPIKIERDSIPKFELEVYTKKLNIRKINNTDRLLEFYVSLYPDIYNRRSRLFISDIKKAIENPRGSTILDIKNVSFVTHKTLGVEDFRGYSYDIKSFDKIIEFNGYYVVKFIGVVVVDGVDIFDEYRVDELDKKYDKKEKKNR
jgi:hypothetical protein